MRGYWSLYLLNWSSSYVFYIQFSSRVVMHGSNNLKFFDLWFKALREKGKSILTYTGQVWRTRGSWSHYKIFFVDEDFWWKTRSSASGKTPLTQPDTSTTLDSCSSTCSRRCLPCKGEAVEAEAVVHTAPRLLTWITAETYLVLT